MLECKYCFEIEGKNVEFIYPCACKTPVCKECLKKHLESKNEIPTHCEICKAKYTYTLSVKIKRPDLFHKNQLLILPIIFLVVGFKYWDLFIPTQQDNQFLNLILWMSLIPYSFVALGIIKVIILFIRRDNILKEEIPYILCIILSIFCQVLGTTILTRYVGRSIFEMNIISFTIGFFILFICSLIIFMIYGIVFLFSKICLDKIIEN